MNLQRYFDYNATTPLCEVAQETLIQAYQQHWFNPSALYRGAGQTRIALEDARQQLADFLNIEPERIVFTSGATEANNALVELWKDRQVAISTLEHPSLREPAQRRIRHLQRFHVKVNAEITWPHLTLAQNAQAPIVSLMAANNEAGILMPWRAAAEWAHQQGAEFHCDASQWLGKQTDIDFSCCDYITGSAHKFGGPKGVGFLVLKSEHQALQHLLGGPQEEQRRAGTENFPAIAAMLSALEYQNENLPQWQISCGKHRDQFEDLLLEKLPGLKIIAKQAQRLPNTSLFTVPQQDNRRWVARLSQLGFAVSTGSACSALHDGSSIVLQALDVAPNEWQRVIRVSSALQSSEADWIALAQAFVDVANAWP